MIRPPSPTPARRPITFAPAALLALGVWAAPAGVLADTKAIGEDDSLMTRETLTGDWGGLRQSLTDKGVAVNLTYLAEGFGNTSGGTRRATEYFGRADLQFDLDLDRLAGWRGATFHLGAFRIDGKGLSTRNLQNLLPVSNAEATASTRLFTVWLEQKLLAGRVSVRAGQLAADDEFLTSPTAGTLINGTFGWAALVASNLPSGGPAYPLATPGVRVAVDPTPSLTLLGAVFSGDPAGRPGAADPQRQNRHGTEFSLRGGAFVMAEAQYKVNQGDGAAGLPGVYKLGGWYHSGTFDDLATDDLGGALAASSSSGQARRHDGSYGFYAVADQMVWREPGTEDEGLTLFLRAGGAPGDRNLVDFYVDGGLGYKGLIPGRGKDTATLGAAYARIGDGARRFDRDTALYSASNGPVRNHEAVIELTYQAELAPWLHLQPDVQYIFNPGGNVAASNNASSQSAIPDAFVAGLRTTVAF